MIENHQKPTEADLDKQIAEATAEVEKIKEEGPNAELQYEEIEAEKDDDQDKSVEKIEESTEEQRQEVQDVDDEVDTESPDYKKKFVESSREAQILAAKNKKWNEAFNEAANVPVPTEEELKSEFPDWDEMTPSQQKMAAKQVHNDRRFSALQQVSEENKNIAAWNDKVSQFIEDPKVLIKNPLLEGKEDEFKLFANKPSRRGVDFEDLVSAFLYENNSKRRINKGQMFETGKGGSKEKPSRNDGKISIAESEKIRKVDFNKYKQLLKAGKIADDFE